jgi:DNA modification methylase
LAQDDFVNSTMPKMKLIREQDNNGKTREGLRGVDHPVQGIMARTGSFPLRVAVDLLAEYGSSSGVVLDPFCGKGTTLLAARLLRLSAFGLDVAPEAVICSSAKLLNIDLEHLLIYISRLRIKGAGSLNEVPSSVKVFFHRKTLRQILSIRDALIRDAMSKERETRSNAVFTLAILLGIAHGHASYSLSISSAHAFSMAPDYVARYAALNGLEAPIRDVKSCLIQKAHRCLDVALPEPVEGEVRLGSSLNCSSVFPELVGKVDLILTSPPYLNRQTYAKDNWLRLWLLGYDHKAIRRNYIETGSPRLYRQYMEKVFMEFAALLKNGGRLICIAGDVALPKAKREGQRRSVFQTGSLLAELAQSERVGLRVEMQQHQVVNRATRYLHALSRSNGHSPTTLVERIFVARKELC